MLTYLPHDMSINSFMRSQKPCYTETGADFRG